MLLSIITVNLNNAFGLRKTIESVLTQSFHNYEWIIIDGGSEDGSCEVISSISKHLSYWVSEKDTGIYNAMNKGIDRSNGDYLLFLNSGDWLVDDCALSRVFESLPVADIVFCNQDIYKNNCLVEHRFFDDRLSFKYLYDNSLGHNSCLIKRCLFENARYNENYRIVSDWEFFLKCALLGKTFVHINTTLGCFDLSGISTTNQALLHEERECVTRHLIPRLILCDIDLLNIADIELSKYKIQMDKQLLSVCYFRTKRKLYRKLLNCYLELIKMLDRVL